MLLNKDYSLANQLVRFKAANGGNEIPKDLRDRVTQLTNKLKDASNKLENYDKKNTQEEVDNIAATKKTKEQIEAEKTELKTSIFDKIKNFFGIGKKPQESKGIQMSAPSKEQLLTDISKDVKKLVKLYAESGVKKLDTIIDDIHTDVSAQYPQITREDIQDVVVGTYAPIKQKPLLDAKKLAIQANVKRIQNEIDLLRDNLKLKQRTKGQMAMDYLHGWHRFALLSSIPSIPKIGLAATMRGVTSRVEGVVGMGLSQIPGLRGIAKGAVREGRMSPKAEAAAFAQWFDKMTYEDLRNIYKTGMSELDIMYGDKKEFASKVPKWMEFFGRMHSMIKYLPKRAEFFRSMELRAEQAIKECKDSTCFILWDGIHLGCQQKIML
jgi:hypothetical protein